MKPAFQFCSRADPRASTPAAWIALLAVAAGLALASAARADDANTNKALATDLFDSGVRKLREGRCDRAPVTDRAICEAARDALKRAYELYPEGLGALRNLAYVEAGLGLVASAARSFRELARRAPHDPSPARRIWADFAQREAEILGARVPHLEIAFSAAPPAQTTLLLDGATLPEAAWRTPLELDPGRHEVRAEAPGHAPYAEQFELAESEHKRIAVELRGQGLVEAAPNAAQAPAPAAEATASSASKRLGPLLVIGAGTAALGVGLGFGYKAMSERDQACGDTQSCEPEGLAAGKRAAHVSTALSVAGGAALASGLVWYFLARRKREAPAAAQLTPALTPGGAMLRAAGSF
jgi:hypothetical protein